MSDDATSQRPAPGAWPRVPVSPSFPALEEEVLARWRDQRVFEASLAAREDAPVWTFYEGPPTANGRPGAHHVEARAFKDLFPRYRTMKGYHVPRKGGWDCHGLPVELEVEKELGLESKADIERFGIEEFNRRCRESVMRYVGDFERLTERIGMWIDTDDPYRTMDATYIDSLWWALKELMRRDLLFEEMRVTPYCARCGTALSDAEVAQGYETVDDPSVYVRMPLLDGPLAERGAALLIWTTTPWTLSNNAAVVAGPDVAYQLVEHGGELLVLAAERREAVLGPDATVVEELAPGDLDGLHYEAPFTLTDYDQEPTGGAESRSGEHAPNDHRYVLLDEYVTTSEGTGLVHISPGFGAEDHAIVRREGLPVFIPVDREGKFTTGPWQGVFVKDADPDIIRALDDSGRLLRAETYTHTYPFCWRCQRPLIYYAKPSWYIRTTAVRDELVANNAAIDWHPDHIRAGRMGNWLENNVDWALSRDRYWGTPLPFWRCGQGHLTVVDSRAELSEVSGQDLSDLDPHRPYVDAVTFDCPDCGERARRVPDVADAWFDSGAMPFAQWGYPHLGGEQFERHFPADYICEALDQTRGWFYTLLAESTLLFGRSSYETVLCLGIILGEDGRRMSTSRGTALDPFDLIDSHGADALRWLMFAEGSPWTERRVGHNIVEGIVRRFLLTLWNTHVFFTTYARIDGFALDDPAPAVSDRPAVDRWVLAELADLVETVDVALAGYDVTSATRRIERFVDDLSNWYVRRNRRRFWKSVSEDPADKAAAYHTLHTCLTTLAKVLAPFTPFVADILWDDLVRSQDPDLPVSVHLTDFPQPDPGWRDDDLREAMTTARHVVELGRQARNDSGRKVRQPLARALVSVPEPEREGLRGLLADVGDELNVKQIDLSDGADELVERRVKANFRVLGPAFQSRAPAVADAITGVTGAEAEQLADDLAAGSATLAVDGDTVTLTPEMVEVVETPRTGWALASDPTSAFALDTDLSDELQVEGVARELVRALNEQRKSLGLALEDRVQVAVHVTPSALDQRLSDAGWYDWLGREVLATAVHRRPEADAIAVALGDLGDAMVSVVAD